MRKLFLISLMIPAGLLAQVSDDFSDGDLSSDPAWIGDINHFKISNSTAVPQEQRPALQLDAPAAGTSALAFSQSFSGELEWHFWAKLSLNTSAGNYARIYLFSDNPNLKMPLAGYFLQVGGPEDSVIFYRQDSLEITRMLRLNTAFTGNSTNALRFKITRSHDGAWKFYCDSLGGQVLNWQGEINDMIIPSGQYFGISCLYSSSNATKFYFDDFYAGPLIVDSVAPALLRADVANPSEILLTFSEAVDRESAENILSYEIDPGIGHPYEAIRLLDPAQVHLFLDHPLQNGLNYDLKINSVADLSGNESGQVTIPVGFYKIAPYDLVITEIMADPSPPRDLPEYEYLELCNRSGFSLNIEDLRLMIGSNEFVLPSYDISPSGYLLICDDGAVEVMQHVAPAVSLSSFVLPNSGAMVHLTDTAGKTICFIDYSLNWYKVDDKSEGGWSLEMIDPSQPCKAGENWMASVSADGGTPGKVNSVSLQLSGGPGILNACCISDSELKIEFSESLDSLSASDTSRYVAGPFLGHPAAATPLQPGFRSVGLKFNQDFSTGRIYNLAVNPGLKNCVGEEVASVLEAAFALAQPVEPFDIIINEILFNPLGDGVDFVEIYNRSAKTINLEELVLASVKNSPLEQPDTQTIAVASSCRVIFPGQYLALTADPDLVRSQYPGPEPGAFLELPSFPAYNNDEGGVLLMNHDSLVIDGMNYTEDMHFLMLNSFEGVSLERISPDRPGNDPSNWHSAAETSGFGTPGYKNSQYLEITEDGATLSLQPEVFTPDGDGRDDNLGIVYHFDSPGKLITVLIFNADGKLARTLVNNEMPGSQGIYSWDGTLDDRTKAQNGIYIIYMEALGMDGKMKHYKKAAVLTRDR